MRLSYLVNRLLLCLLTLLGVSVIVALLMHVAPGDPIQTIAGTNQLSPEQMAAVRQYYGLDQPVAVQFVQWLGKVVRGDLGKSIVTRDAITSEIAHRFPVTLELTTLAIIVSVLIAVPAGIISAVKQNTKFDYAATFIALLGISMPGFWIGINLILIFSLLLRWLPPAGFVALADAPWLNLRHMIMPAIALGLPLAALVTRMTRSSMLEILRLDYVNTARAKGSSEISVIVKHALRNALVPVVTVVGLQMGYLLGGAVIIEKVFALPGIGRYLITGIFNRDYPVVQGVVLVTAAVFVLVNLLVDVLYTVLDPRIRLD